MASPQGPNAQTPLEAVATANIVVGSVFPDNFQAKYLLDQDPLGIWEDYVVNNAYKKDNQTLPLPVASPNGFKGQSCVHVQVAAPTEVWVCDWTAARSNERPSIPNPQPADKRWVLLKETVEPAMVAVGADGTTPYYRISGTYVYSCKAPHAVTVDDACFSRPPWLMDVFPRTVPQTLFQHNLDEIVGKGGNGASPGNPGAGH